MYIRIIIFIVKNAIMQHLSSSTIIHLQSTFVHIRLILELHRFSRGVLMPRRCIVSHERLVFHRQNWSQRYISMNYSETLVTHNLSRLTFLPAIVSMVIFRIVVVRTISTQILLQVWSVCILWKVKKTHDPSGISRFTNPQKVSRSTHVYLDLFVR